MAALVALADEVDLVGTVELCGAGQSHDVVDGVVAAGEVDDRGDAHAAARQQPRGEGDLTWPDAHGGHLSVPPGRARAQRDDIGVGGVVAELGEVEQRDGSVGGGTGVVRHGATLTPVTRAQR